MVREVTSCDLNAIADPAGEIVRAVPYNLARAIFPVSRGIPAGPKHRGLKILVASPGTDASFTSSV